MHPRHAIPTRPVVLAAISLIMLLAACAPAAGTSASPSASTEPSAASPDAASPSVDSGASPTSMASPEPTDDLGAFTCDLPISGAGTMARAQITDLRVGTHADYDRIVIEFDDGIPPFTLDTATPPLTADPSGREMDVDGAAFWSLVLQGGTRVNLDGTESYDGPTDLTPDFPALAELVEAGDFEAVSSWYIGLDQAGCARVLTLDEPSRLVIDIQH